MVAALLHDTLEDTETDFSEISSTFGDAVANLVRELTSDKDKIKQMGKNKYLIDKMLKMSDDTFTIKLCDRLSNISDLPSKSYLHDILEMMYQLEAQELKAIHRQIMSNIRAVITKKLSDES
jgi:(p)ppGpp synthase/HD superfamily hydrolase